MVSNKRQDFQHARWQLSQDYPKFVERSPLAAARAMVAVVSAYCREKVIESQKWRDEFRKLIESDHPVDGTAEAMLDDDTEF
jgi:predicted secreted protein